MNTNILNIKCLNIMMAILTKQHLRNIWSSIHQKVKQHWCWVEKSDTYKKSMLLNNNIFGTQYIDSRYNGGNTYLLNNFHFSQRSRWPFKCLRAKAPPWSQNPANFSSHKYCESENIDFLKCYVTSRWSRLKWF